MAFRFVAILSVLAMASAGILPGDNRYGLDSHQAQAHQVITHHGNTHHQLAAAPLISLSHGHNLNQHYDHHEEEHHAPAQYQFSYGVKDAHTGDIKEQEEKRDGDHVQGHYSLVEADGTRRVVHYQDNGHGFEAQVTREGHAVHEAPRHHDSHHGAAIHIAAAPIHAIHAAPAHYESHGHHASSFQNTNLRQDSHHGHHY